MLSDAATRALGNIIGKFKCTDNITYETYSKCFHTNVNPITDYGAEVWGYLKEASTYLIQIKAIRSYLGIHKFAPKLALLGDMGWTPSFIRRKLCLLRYWNRLIKMDNDRLTKMVFLNDYENESVWCNSIKSKFSEVNLPALYENKLPCDLKKIAELLLQNYSKLWKQQIAQKPKLRTYCLLKEEFGTEKYVRLNLSRSQRSLLTQLRTRILPLEIETGRFRGIDVKDRLCTFCQKVEDETHFLFTCQNYKHERTSFLSSLEEDIKMYSQAELLKYLCNNYPRKISKYVNRIWSTRKQILYN